MNKFVILFLNVKNGNPADTTEDSPVVIRQMCKELMEEHDVIEQHNVIAHARRVAKTEGVVLTDGYPPALNGMAWGDWCEVGYVKRDPSMRMFVVKVVDADITEIDRRWKAGTGGGW